MCQPVTLKYLRNVFCIPNGLYASSLAKGDHIIQSFDRLLIKIFNVSLVSRKLLRPFVDFSILFGFCISLSHQRYTKFAIFLSSFPFECYNEGTNFKNKTRDERRQRNVIVGERFHKRAGIFAKLSFTRESFLLKDFVEIINITN